MNNSMITPIKILITEDHELYRDGLRLLIESMYTDVQVFEAPDYSSTINHLSTQRDIYFLLLDIKIPGTKGLDGLKEIRKRFPTLTIIVVSTLDFYESVGQMMKFGANGFIAKTSPKGVMANAIKQVLAGEKVVVSEQDLSRKIEFSPRQTDTLELLVQGKSNKEIANHMGISQATVREYVSHIFRLLQAENRTQAVLLAKKRGFFFERWD